MRTRLSTAVGYREISGSAPATLRPILCITALLVGLVLVYTAVHDGHDLRSEHWLFALAVAALFVARGLHLFRPVTLTHVTLAVAAVVLGDFAYRADHLGAGFTALASAGFLVMLP